MFIYLSNLQAFDKKPFFTQHTQQKRSTAMLHKFCNFVTKINIHFKFQNTTQQKNIIH